jgi:molybdopterin-guanine dinucleotide biosynthesis protein A
VETFVSGRPEKDYAEFGCPVLRDKFADAGPLAGIERALDSATSSLLLVLAVDLPGMKVGVLQRLAAGCAENYGAIPRLAGNIEPLAAFYPKSSQLLAESLLCGGHNTVATFAGHCVRSGLARFVDQPPGEAVYFINWNSPSDLVSEARHGQPAA